MNVKNDSRNTLVNSSLRDSFLNRIKTFENKKINSRYKLMEELGSGGFGVVYKANDSILDKDVAIKFLNPDFINSEKKFHRVKREINISQKITDKRIVKIFSLEKFEEVHFLVMEYVEGRSLRDKLGEGEKIDWEKFKPLFMNVMKAVKTLHDHGIIHRDLKPSNIFLTGSDEIKLLDFGLSKEISDVEKTSSIGEIIGSPHYMSPEQANMSDLGMRSDIYQLGLILYRVLSGKLPFDDSSNTLELIFKRVLEKPDKIDRNVVSIPKYVEFGIFKAIERRTEDRFNSIDEMILYFEKGRYSLFGKIIHTIKKHPVRTISMFILILSLTFSGYYFLINSNVLKSIRHHGSKLEAFNPLGIKLWEKDFKPHKISEVFKMDEKILIKYDIGNRNSLTDTDGFIAILNDPEIDQDSSIASLEFDNKVSLLTNDGNELTRLGFFYFFNLGRYDFIKKFYIHFVERTDLDNDGEQEIILKIRHYMDMFPTAFVLIKDLNFYSFANPGIISETECFEADNKHSRFIIQGMNNILSHIYFIAEVKFDYENSYIKNQTGFPNLKHDNKFYPEFICFLPKFFKEDITNWETKGFIKVVNYHTGEEIIVGKDYSLTIKSDRGILRYKNSRENLFRIYRLIDDYYQEKWTNKNLVKAYQIISRCFEISFENPYLRSALLYFKGDLEVALGKLSEGERTLEESMRFYDKNLDSARRLCEIEFLRDNPERALEKIFNDFGHISNFWGLSFGREIFRSFCEIQMGNFLKAEEIYSLYFQKSNLQNMNLLNGVLSIFKGSYNEAIDLLRKTDDTRIFTLAELRLFLARAMLLSETDLKRAQFYFKDLSLYSLSLSYLATMSNCYFKVKSGETDISIKDIIDSFNVTIDHSKVDFQGKLWLFYDAYIYGKTMEILNNKNEAISGYNLSIRSNPYTELAEKSKKNLDRLLKK